MYFRFVVPSSFVLFASGTVCAVRRISNICNVFWPVNVTKSVMCHSASLSRFFRPTEYCVFDGIAVCRLTWKCSRTFRQIHVTDSPGLARTLLWHLHRDCNEFTFSLRSCKMADLNEDSPATPMTVCCDKWQ